MPITLVTGPANAGKAQVVLDAVRRHARAGREPLLVVPTRADVRALHARAGRGRRRDGRAGGALRRSDRGGRPAGGHPQRRCSGDLARERLIAALAAASDGRCTRRRGLRARPGRAHRRAAAAAGRARGASTAALASWAAAEGPHASAAALARLYAGYQRELARLGMPRRRAARDARARRAARAARAVGGTPVLFYGFDDLTRCSSTRSRRSGALVDAEVTVSLTYEAGRTAFAGRAATLPGARAACRRAPRAARARRLLRAGLARRALATSSARCSSPSAARVGAGRCGAPARGWGRARRARAGRRARSRGCWRRACAAEEIAVVGARRRGRARAARRRCSRAPAFPFAIQRRRPLGDTRDRAGADRAAALRAPRRRGGEAAGTSADLLAWLRAPGLLERPGARRRARAASCAAGRQDAARARTLWERAQLAAERDRRAREAPAAALAGGADRARRRGSSRGCSGAAPRRRAAAGRASERTRRAALAAAARRWRELRELAGRAPELAPGDARELAARARARRVPRGERPGPGAVAVLDPLALRARRVRALFLCGLQEGVFPAPARRRSRCSPRTSACGWREASGLRLGEPRGRAGGRALPASTRPSPARRSCSCLSWHVADDDGEPGSRSLFVDDVCDLFDDEPRGAPRAARARLAAAVAGAGGERRRPGRPLAAGPAAHRRAPARRRCGSVPGRRPRWRPGSAVRCAGSSSACSPTRRSIPNAEPLARGGLAHPALAGHARRAARERTGSARLTPERLALARELLCAGARGGRGGPRPLGRSRAHRRRPAPPARRPRALPRVRRGEPRVRSSPATLELGFGFDRRRRATSELPAFELGERREAAWPDRPHRRRRGRQGASSTTTRTAASRLRTAGSPTATSRWRCTCAPSSSCSGCDVVGGFYQPLSGESLRARGVLDEDSGLEIDCTRGDERTGEEMRELLDDLVELALPAASQAGAGELEPRPRTCGFGDSGCQYPTICRCER